MIKIIFVCIGNICRSPLAETIMNKKIADKGLSEHLACDSAGTGGWHEGEMADKRTLEIAEKYNLNVTHRARQVRPRDLFNHEYVVTMDEYVFSEVKRMIESRTANCKLIRMREFDSEKDKIEVPDPYNGSDKDFERTYEILDRCCGFFLDYLITEHQLKK